ncbi:hypothetical protein [Spiroplasma endosymbiont of Virgichneumon dumeticola]|uniref:hypothetical protein n=1 Tax=Spiroplasma endosymbiont of Virgichneumon dumeticola TaxID=3139323 RepID=UPI0035C8AF44
MKKESIIKEDIVIMDGNMELMNKSLIDKKIILAAIELGEHAQHTVDTGWSDHFQAHAKLKGETKTGTCFCQKPATHLVYFWR